MSKNLIRDILLMLLLTIPFGLYFSRVTNVKYETLKVADDRINSIDAVLGKFQTQDVLSKTDLEEFKNEYTAVYGAEPVPQLASINASLPDKIESRRNTASLDVKIELLEEKVKNIEKKIDTLESSQWSPWLVTVLLPLFFVVLNPSLTELGNLLRHKLFGERTQQ